MTALDEVRELAEKCRKDGSEGGYLSLALLDAMTKAVSERDEVRAALAWYADGNNYEPGGAPGRPLSGHYDRWEMDSGRRARETLAKYGWKVSRLGGRLVPAPPNEDAPHGP